MTDLLDRPASSGPGPDQSHADGSWPPLPAPPDLGDIAAAASEASHRFLMVANRCAFLPLHRAGLSAWIGNPLTGYQLLLTTTGRKSGRRREAPLEYVVADGAAWVMAGYGSRTLWYRNIQAHPRVEVLLPGGRAFVGTAEEILDPSVREPMVLALARATGLPGFLLGVNPWTAPAKDILRVVAWVPLIRITPVTGPLVAGPDDPGGLAWIPRQLVVTLAMVWLARALVPRLRR